MSEIGDVIQEIHASSTKTSKILVDVILPDGLVMDDPGMPMLETDDIILSMVSIHMIGDALLPWPQPYSGCSLVDV